MDTVSHGVIGALAARACATTSPRSLLIVTAVAAAFPDIDYLLFWLNPYKFITEWHRGLTHSLLILPLWAALITVACRRFLDGEKKAGRWLYFCCCLGLLSHILLDLVTPYGVQILAPASDQRFQLPLAFDFDPWFALMALISLILAMFKRLFALTGLLAICVYLLFLHGNRQSALAVIENHLHKTGRKAVAVYALPRPAQPFHWKLIIVKQNEYEIARLSLSGAVDQWIQSLNGYVKIKNNLAGKQSAQSTADAMGKLNTGAGDYQVSTRLQWRKIATFGDDPATRELAQQAWNLDSFSSFRKFALLPVLYRIDREPHTDCVWFTDLRYVFSFMSPPFRYGSCRQKSSREWRLYRLKRQSENDRQLMP